MARRKGEGGIILKNRTYFWRIDINGKRKSKALKAKTYKEAEQEAKQYIKATNFEDQIGFAVFKAETKNLIKASKLPDIRDLFKVFTTDKKRPNCTEKTLRQHKKYWIEFVSWLETYHPNIIKFSDIDTSVVNQYFNYIDEVLQGAAYNYRRNSLNLIFHIVFPEEINPFSSIKKIPTVKSIKKAMPEELFWKVIDAFKDTRFYIAYRDEFEVLFYIGAFSGMRLKDCCLLQWDKIDFNNNSIFCIPEKTKYSSSRLVEFPLIDDLKEKLITAMSWRKNEYVLPELSRMYQREESFASKKTKWIFDWVLCEEDKLKNSTSSLNNIPTQYDYSFHSLRHAFASFCYMNGIPKDKVKEVLGHTSEIVTSIYTHTNRADMAKIAAALPSRYGHQNTAEEKLKEIKELITAKDKLTQTDKKILNIVG